MCCVFTACRYGDDLDALEEEGDEGEAGGESEEGTGLSRFGRRRDGADEDDEGQEEEGEGEEDEEGQEDGGRSAKRRQQQQLSAEELELMYTSVDYQPGRRMGSLDTAAIPGVEVWMCEWGH